MLPAERRMFEAVKSPPGSTFYFIDLPGYTSRPVFSLVLFVHTGQLNDSRLKAGEIIDF